MIRPFALTIRPDASPGTLELRLDFEEPQTSEQMRGWQDVVQTFANLAECGAICGSAIPPWDSECALKGGLLESSTGLWSTGHARFDTRGLFILANLCHWGHIHVSKLRACAIFWAPCGSLGVRPEFPAAWDPVSYELEQYELVGQLITVDILFRSPQSPETREQINDVIGRWFKAANWAGYADDDFPPARSTVLLGQQVMTTGPVGITWYIETILCSDAVFAGLTNCLERVSRTLAPIERVVIGE